MAGASAGAAAGGRAAAKKTATPAKKTAAKKTATAGRAPAKKTAAKKTTAKKTTTGRRPPAKKTAAKKTAAKKTTPPPPPGSPEHQQEMARKLGREQPKGHSREDIDQSRQDLLDAYDEGAAERAAADDQEEGEESSPGLLSRGFDHQTTQTGAGIVLGIVAYAVLVNYLKGGVGGVKTWFRAKFLNDDTQHGGKILGVVPHQGIGGAVGKGMAK